MPFLAICPYCNTGRIRCPEKALGLTASCPNCKTNFTMVDSGFPVDVEPEPVSAIARTQPTVVPAPAPGPAAVFRSPTMQAVPVETQVSNDDEEDGRSFDPLRVPTLLAFSLAGVALVASQIPYGRIGTVVLAAFGLIVAFIGWYSTRRPVLSASATGLNALILLIVSLAPTWLGIDPWRPEPIDKERLTPQAFDKDGLKPTSEWTDVRQSWQFDDVRVRVIATLEQIELTGPKGQKKWTKPTYLKIRVAVGNVGVARAFDVVGWDLKTPMKLTDANGKELAPLTFEANWEPTLRREHAKLTPRDTVEHDYLFEVSANPGAFFRLELPGGPCGAAEQTIRFQIPARPLGYLPPKG